MSSLLPNGKQHFDDNNGRPLVGGRVYYYIPNTSTPKNTWQDEAMTILNTNPITLDTRGECTAWGTGSYRQVVRDFFGNLIWDKIVTDLSAVIAEQDAMLRADLANASDPEKGAAMVGYRDGTVKSVLDGETAFGDANSHVDANGTGPLIARPWNTTEDMLLFVSPSTGNDSNPGTQSSPLKTLNAALQKIPQNIYHKVRIYTLDGDYGTEAIKAFNYFVTPRGTAGFMIIGHVADVFGEPHPIYTDNNPDAVVFRAPEHVIAGINGTEEFTIAGIRFQDGWCESYDSHVTFYRCNFDGGQQTPTYSTRHALGGHYCDILAIFCNFTNVAQIGTLSDAVNATFETCTLTGLVLTSAVSFPGVPFVVGGRSVVYIKTSPTLLQTGPGGKSISGNGGLIFDFEYSPIGYNAVRRATPDRDEQLLLLGHNGAAMQSGFGAGISLAGNNYTPDRGSANVEFGSDGNAMFRARHYSNSTGITRNVLTASSFGEVMAFGGLGFGPLLRAASAFLPDDRGCFYQDATGNIFVLSKKAGVIKYTKLLDWATAPVL